MERMLITSNIEVVKDFYGKRYRGILKTLASLITSSNCVFIIDTKKTNCLDLSCSVHSFNDYLHVFSNIKGDYGLIYRDVLSTFKESFKTVSEVTTFLKENC